MVPQTIFGYFVIVLKIVIDKLMPCKFVYACDKISKLNTETIFQNYFKLINSPNHRNV